MGTFGDNIEQNKLGEKHDRLLCHDNVSDLYLRLMEGIVGKTINIQGCSNTCEGPTKIEVPLLLLNGQVLNDGNLQNVVALKIKEQVKNQHRRCTQKFVVEGGKITFFFFTHTK